MARSRGTRFPMRSGSLKRKVTWAEGPVGQILSKTSSQVVLFGVGQQATIDDLTLVRTRGSLLVQLSTASAIDESFQWSFGMCIVNENAAGVGITAVPDPLADIAWDGWFVHEQGTLASLDATPLAAPQLGTAQRISIDSKAMRKLHATDVILGVIKLTEVGACTVSAFLDSRILLKLP